ncbi:acyl-ACP--UDP-N-acetylglucosamine O-acyltransferase [Spirulina sp. CS-785/01]|uniref:acyl-ACP--UDP-N-acetylglucosamine O-acyltransferase n=1 Tax=Spirulina sp. CS-785/01 TaxID=3021716 RepID=UPI002330B049|nr:acyl-ACP--UDP-N-acetylglucosamine O-acyltransferase [Spirulina sp. CS-785/01]MDB9315431.1 acyl-ACP--UDP-N-acetylglucosamine O-acyltransferase [Spirulina sp. CS-785/01]
MTKLLHNQTSAGVMPLKPTIHPTAIIHPDADLDPSVQVGPYAVIGEKVKIGADTTIGAHVVISGPTEIGVGNHIFPGAAIGLEPQDLKYKGAESRVRIGNHNRIREYVTINRATDEGEETILGDHNLLMAYSHVAHNCILGNRVIIANNVALAGHVEIESHVTIGGVLGIHQFVHIGTMAMLGGMSRIDRDVPPYMLVEGNPGRVRSLNLVGLKRMGITGEEISQLKKAFRLLYRSDVSFTQAVDQLAILGGGEPLTHLQRFLQSSLNAKRRGPMPGSRK